MDEALCLPSEAAVQIALRTQQLIAYETGVTDTVDPLAGSYFVESLTDEVYESAKAYIQKIDDMGGAPSAIEKGYIQREIQDSAYRYQREIEQDERTVVGLNRFEVEEARPTNLLRVDPAVRELQIKKLEKLRSGRDDGAVQKSLSDLKRVAEGKANLMPMIVKAVKARATLGEICDILREVFGEYKQESTLG
jgi:methylmalonyl-CoA mutase N-terminal domain/subunit